MRCPGMSEGFTSRAFRLTFSYSSATPSFSSYICLPSGDFWEGTSRLEQIGLSAVPVEGTLCWSLAPSIETSDSADTEKMSRRRSISIETFGVDELDEEEVEDSEYIPFVVGTSVVASGVIKLSLLNTEVRGSKNSVRLFQPNEQEPNGTLKVIYDFRPEGNAVLIPWIPSLLTPADFLAFIRDAQGIVDIRLVRDASPGKYMALIRLNSRRHALRFADQFNGRPFSPLEPDLCQVLWMAEIEFVTRVVSIVPLFDLADFKESVQIAPSSINDDEKHQSEVPSCPVCLERLDSSVTGIITTICSHSYHCDCMLKWYDGSCPVCRFLLSEEDEKDRSQCTECGCRENLWVCLICGNIGCGRYRSKHAEGHFEGTGHTFSLELETHRVWDYVGDNYVHRLVQNQDDGKLIEISHPGSPEPTSDGTKKKSEDPDYISSLLVAQLESQRIFYEEKLSALEVSWSHQNKSVQSEANLRIESLEVSIRDLETTSKAEYKKLKQELSTLEDRIEVLKKEKATLQKALDSETAMLERVMSNQQGLEDTIREKESAITELQEQIADLLMHIEGQKVVAQSDIAEELRIGSITLVDAPIPAKTKKAIRRKR